MKIILIVPLMAILLLACEKDEIENTCPVISSESVPEQIVSGFTAKYPGTTVETWFNKEGSYVAGFEKDGKDRFAKFGSDGNFQNEFKEDDNEFESGCECEDENED